MDKIENQSLATYEYQINPNEPAITGESQSNITETDLVLGELTMTKSVDKEYATIGDILTYTIDILNVGNVLVSDVVFTDIVPDGVMFVPGSVVIDGTPQPTYDPNLGFNLGAMLILASKKVVFQVEVTSLPVPNIVSNKADTEFNYLVIVPITGSSTSNAVTTTINVSEITLVKTASVDAVTTGDTLTYTIVITNNGNIDATDLEFVDEVPASLTFVVGSVVVNGTPQPTYDPNLGFNLGTLAPTDSITIVFDTVVN